MPFLDSSSVTLLNILKLMEWNEPSSLPKKKEKQTINLYIYGWQFVANTKAETNIRGCTIFLCQLSKRRAKSEIHDPLDMQTAVL